MFELRSHDARKLAVASLHSAYQTVFSVGPFYANERVRPVGKVVNGRVFVGSLDRGFSGWIDLEYLEPINGVSR